MRHYEIVLIVNPDLSDQIPSMIQRYTQLIQSKGGQIHRKESEEYSLVYPIERLHKAYYILMNIECDQETLKELKEIFHFNDAIVRNLIIKKNEAVTEPSILAQQKKKEAMARSDTRSAHSKGAFVPRKRIDEEKPTDDTTSETPKDLE